MELQLAGKCALVTGSSSGIGEGVALMLAAEGADVIVHGRDRARSQRTADAIRALGGRADIVIGDLTDAAQAAEICAQTTALGGVDILVNNAGGRSGGWARDGWFNTSADAWIATYKLNVIATAVMINGLTPHMISKKWGRIIQISSAVALHQPPNFPDYQAAKAAEINMSRSLSRGLAGTGVTANSISAGIINTPGSDGEIASIATELGLEGGWQQHERHIALNVFRQTADRVGRPEDIAAAVCFLASPKAAFITGVNLIIDGGM